MTKRQFFLLFMVPTFGCLFLFAFYPLGTAIYYSLHDWDMRSSAPMSFVGLGNFVEMFQDPRFLNALKVSGQFLALTVLGSLALAFLVAPLVHETAKGWRRHLAIFVFILPAVLPRIGAAYMWRLMYDPSLGIINYLLSLVGLGPYIFLQNPRNALPSIAVIDIWQWGFLLTALVVILLDEVPKEVIEAARLDGASALSLYTRIMYPLVLPLSLPLVFIKMMESLRSFDFIFVLTAGGPGIATETLDMYAYWQGMGSSGRISYASAMSLFMVVMSIVLVTFLWKALRRWHE
ncbi:MAG TPA: sugar ABC transporter permease [Trueperaceae bacterium]|nr:sugar ABC transporter permease [Trueperaceae bacterium]